MQRRCCFSHADVTLLIFSSNMNPKLFSETPINSDITNSVFSYLLSCDLEAEKDEYVIPKQLLYYETALHWFVSSSPGRSGWRHLSPDFFWPAKYLSNLWLCVSQSDTVTGSLLGYFLEFTFAESRDDVWHGLLRNCSQWVQLQILVTCVLKKQGKKGQYMPGKCTAYWSQQKKSSV